MNCDSLVTDEPVSDLNIDGEMNQSGRDLLMAGSVLIIK
jgi:hypothetical protein